MLQVMEEINVREKKGIIRIIVIRIKVKEIKKNMKKSQNKINKIN